MSKKERLPWFKMYPGAYLEATRDLTPEQRGIYTDCLLFLYRDEAPLPKNNASMAFMLRVNVRVWRRVKDALITLGMLIETPDGYVNKRATIELEERKIRRSFRESSATLREYERRIAPELPLDFNEARARLRPQMGSHARASSDHQREKEEESKKEQTEVLPTRQMDDDDPYNRRRELDPKIVETMQQRIGQKRTEHILKAYFRSHYAKGAGLIDKAFPGWLAKSYGEKISAELTPKELAAEILDLCGGRLTLPTAEQLASRRKKA